MLKLLKNLKSGDTINLATMSIEPHFSKMTSAKRWFYGENRYKTISEIENTINNTIKSLSCEFDELLHDQLLASATGIRSLLNTYSNDDICVYRLMRCLKMIECYSIALKNVQRGVSMSSDDINQLFVKLMKEVPNNIKIKDKNILSSSDNWKKLIGEAYQNVYTQISNRDNQKKIIKTVAPHVIQATLFPGYNSFFVFLSLKYLTQMATKNITL